MFYGEIDKINELVEINGKGKSEEEKEDLYSDYQDVIEELRKFQMREYECTVTQADFSDEDFGNIAIAYTDYEIEYTRPHEEGEYVPWTTIVEVQSRLNIRNKKPQYILNIVGDDRKEYPVEIITYDSLGELSYDISMWDFDSVVYPNDWEDFGGKVKLLMDSGII